jgi:hypothetical protein
MKIWGFEELLGVFWGGGGRYTLQLADELVVTQSPDGTWFVAVRWVCLGV